MGDQTLYQNWCREMAAGNLWNLWNLMPTDLYDIGM
jgi:hypothetical protein